MAANVGELIALGIFIGLLVAAGLMIYLTEKYIRW